MGGRRRHRRHIAGINGYNEARGPSPEEAALSAMVDYWVETGASESSAECVAQGLRDGGYVDDLSNLSDADLAAFSSEDFILSEGFADAPPEIQHLIEGVFLYLYDPTVGCLSPADLTAMAQTPMPGVDAGFTEAVESLTAGCRVGSWSDCDMLMLAAEPGSTEAEVATTCGESQEAIDFNFTTCMIENGSEAEYQQVIDQCQSGFNLACDLVFVLAVDSADQTLGATCGGRGEANSVLPCWLRLGAGTRT